MKIWSKSVEDVASVERVLAVWLVPIVSITLLGAAQALWRRLGKPHAGPGGHAPHGQQQHQHRQAPHEFSLATSQLDTGGTLLAPARSSLASASLQPQGVSGWMHMILVLLAYWLASHAVQAWHRGGSLLDRSWHATFFHVGPMFSSWAVQLVIFVATTYGYQAAVVRGMLPRRWEVPLQAALELASFALPIMFMGTRTDWPLLQRIAFGMETAVFLFKQHSYITTNRILREEVERGGPGTGYWVHKLHRMGSPTSVSAPTSTVSASYSHSHAQSQSASDITVGTERSGSASARSPARRSPRISESAIDGHAGASVRATTTSDANGGGGTFDMMPATTTATATTTGSAGSTSDGSASSLTQGTSSLGSLRLRRRAHPLQPLAADAIAAAESLDGTEMAPPTGTITDSGAVPLTAAAGPVSASLPRSGGGNGASHSHNGGTISAASGGSAGAGGVLSTFFRWLKNRYMEDTVRAGGHLRAHEQARRAGAAAASAAHVSEALGGDVSSIAGSAAAAVAKTPSGKSSLPGELPSPAAAAAEDVGAALPVSPCTPWPAGGDACSSGGISGEDDAAEETLLRDPDFARAAAATMAKAMPVHYAGARSQGAAEGASRRSATLEVVPEGSRPRGDSNAVPLFKSSAAATATDGHDQHGSTSATAPTSEHRHAAAAAIRRSVSGVIHSVMRGVEVDTKVVAYPSNVCFKDFAYFVLAPVLVYEPNYPRVRGPIRPLYVLEKLMLALGTIAVANFVAATTFVPVAECMGRLDPFAAVLQLAAPSMLVVLCIFFVVFECILNGVAELTRFGDRRFYDDWWASTSFSEFSRRWNRPVHEFFLRHAYLDGMRRWGLRPAKALAATFLISIIMHEAIIYAALEGPPPWLALMSLIQFPLMGLMRAPWIKGKVLGNLTFHAFLTVGLGIVITLYGRHYCSLDPAHCDFGGAAQRTCN